ncbi:Histidine-containing phosphotransfer protein 4 [Capsicum annuum]|nr:Histidine-containing phosphotransfer protein 4 [Capsicum annuum]
MLKSSKYFRSSLGERNFWGFTKCFIEEKREDEAADWWPSWTSLRPLDVSPVRRTSLLYIFAVVRISLGQSTVVTVKAFIGRRKRKAGNVMTEAVVVECHDPKTRVMMALVAAYLNKHSLRSIKRKKWGYVDEQFIELEELQDDATPNFVEEVVSLFYEDSARLIHAIDQSLENHPIDFAKLDNYMYQFKGSSSSIGAKKVKTECTQFMEYCRARNVEGPAFITLVRWGTDEEKDGGGRGGRLKGGDRDRVGYIESSREGGEGEGGYRESSGGGSGGEEMLCYVYDNSSFQHEYWILLNWDGGGGGTKICRNTSLDTFLFETQIRDRDGTYSILRDSYRRICMMKMRKSHTLWVREYHWDVRGDDADDPTTYIVAFGETEAHYMMQENFSAIKGRIDSTQKETRNLFSGTYEFHNFQEVPLKGKKIILLDKQSCPNLRIRQTKDAGATS